VQQDHYLKDAISQLRKLKELADKAVARVAEKDLFFIPDENSNSIAIIMKHMGGNMRSRWRDFLTSDGEKPDRNRDSEFLIKKSDSKESILQAWERGWQYVFEALGPLEADDLNKTVLIRTEPHTIIEAINRQLTHYAYHVGQIVFLARSLAGSQWQSLSIPREKSDDFNVMMRGKKFRDKR
jgi:hypothetical protein